MFRARALCLAALILLWPMLAGCSGGDGLVEVAGDVSFDGNAVEEGAISFYPMDGKTQTAGGKIKDGRYSARVPSGKMKVVVSMPKVSGYKSLYPKSDSPKMPVTTEALPPKYSDFEKTELELDVVAGKNAKNWDLTSK